MKFMCLGYYNEKQWDAQSPAQQNSVMDECFAYDDVLRKDGHFTGGEALGPTGDAKTLRWRNGDVSVSDGPYTEAKEVLGGVLILEARDLAHAVELMKKHPALKAGNFFEIRAVADMTPIIRESEARRSTGKSR